MPKRPGFHRVIYVAADTKQSKNKLQRGQSNTDRSPNSPLCKGGGPKDRGIFFHAEFFIEFGILARAS